MQHVWNSAVRMAFYVRLTVHATKTVPMAVLVATSRLSVIFIPRRCSPWIPISFGASTRTRLEPPRTKPVRTCGRRRLLSARATATLSRMAARTDVKLSMMTRATEKTARVRVSCSTHVVWKTVLVTTTVHMVVPVRQLSVLVAPVSALSCRQTQLVWKSGDNTPSDATLIVWMLATIVSITIVRWRTKASFMSAIVFAKTTKSSALWIVPVIATAQMDVTLVLVLRGINTAQ